MNFTQFVLILRARVKIILSVVGLVLLVTLIANLRSPKIYKATNALVLNYKGMDPVTGLTLPSQLMPGYIATQIDIITSRSVALKVVEKLKFAENPEAKLQFQKATKGNGDIRLWYADLILNNLEVKPSRESSVIEITFSGTDPDFAATMANAFAEAYQEKNIQLKVDPSQVASDYLAEKAKSLRNNLEKAQANLSKYQQQKGLTSVMGSMDVESARLNELSTQLVMAQSQSFDASSRQQHTRGNIDDSPDIAANPVVQSLKIQITQVETKLSELSQRFGTSHPQYQSTELELSKLKSQLEEASRKASSGIGGSAHINKQRVEELKAAVEQQKAKVLKLNLSRDELSVLQRDVEDAQHALDVANQRYTQTTLEGSSNQADIVELSTALPPTGPSSPRIKFNMVLAGFLGTFIGIGIALMVETADSRVRKGQDNVRLLQVPLLAIIRCKEPQGLINLFQEIMQIVFRRIRTVVNNVNLDKQEKFRFGFDLKATKKAEKILFNAELIAITQPSSYQVELLRVLRSQLMQRWFGDGHKSLAIISTLPEDGSCYLAANLAVVFAQLGKRTLLVDANLRDPHQDKIFNLNSIHGLSDVLIGKAGINAISQVPMQENLAIISSGSLSENLHELLSLDTFTSFIKLAEESFDIVLVDTASSVSTADAHDAIAHCEGTIFMTSINKTKQVDLIHLRELVEVAGSKMVGSVLTEI
jgi:chain length determinant protein tyrosine kinase EpsG